MDFDSAMATLPSDQDRAKMVALPYRIGLFISHADKTGGEAAQEAELATLSHILRAFSEDFCKSEFVQGLLGRTMARAGEWPGWSYHLDSVPGECVAAMYDLRGVLEPKHLAAFQEMMMDIALAVAQAYRENKKAAPVAPPGLMARLLGRPKKAARFDHLNISAAERAALSLLADALDYDVPA